MSNVQLTELMDKKCSLFKCKAFVYGQRYTRCFMWKRKWLNVFYSAAGLLVPFLCEEFVMIFTFLRQQPHFAHSLCRDIKLFVNVCLQHTTDSDWETRYRLPAGTWSLFKTRNMILKSINHQSAVYFFPDVKLYDPNSPCDVSSCVPKLWHLYSSFDYWVHYVGSTG